MITDSNLIAVVNSGDTSVVVEFYSSDASPGEDGFDPGDALLRFSEIGTPDSQEIEFFGETYIRRINSMGRTTRTTGADINTFSVELNNEKADGVRMISEFELKEGGFEGLIIVQRLLSRSLSDTYQKSLILFAGRCDAPKGGNKNALTINASQIIGSVDGEMPRRKYSPADPEGRERTDPNFEGFPFTPQYGTVTYSPRQKRSGWWFLAGVAGLLLAHDHAAKTLPWSSFSDVDVDAFVPFGFGRVQCAGSKMAYADVGTLIYSVDAFMEGKIEAFENYRTDDLRFNIVFTVHKRYGYPPGEGPTPYEQVPVPIDPGAPLPEYPGNGYYANTVILFVTLDGTNVDTVDPAPTVIIVVLAKLVATPDADGVWSGENWSDNAAALARHIITEPNYGKLDPSWIDDEAAFECHEFNNEWVFDTSFSDSIFIPDTDKFTGGSSYRGRFLMSTSTARANYFKYLNGDATASETFLSTPYAESYDSVIPIEPVDPGDGGGHYPGGGGVVAGLSGLLKRRYTCNVLLTDSIKIIDFLENVVFVSSRMYMTQAPNGKLRFKNKKPVDFGLALRSSSGTTARIDNISPWIDDKRGFALIDPNTEFSEARTVTGAIYLTSVGTTFTSDVDGGAFTLTPFADTALTTDPGAANLLVNSVVSGDVLDFILNDVDVTFIPGDDDTPETVAGFIFALINAHPRLKRQFRAVWSPGDDNVDIQYTAGTLTFSAALIEAHDAPLDNPTDAPTASAGSGTLAAGDYQIGYTYDMFRGETLISPLLTITLSADQRIEVDALTPPSGATSVRWYCSPGPGSAKLRFVFENEGGAFNIETLPLGTAAIIPDLNRTGAEIMRVEKVFSDRSEPRTGLTASNILRDTLKWQIGKEATVNRIDLKFRDSSQDFRLVELRLKDDASIDKLKKVAPKAYNGQAIDNYNQAYRVASGFLAEARDANFFYDFASNKSALLLEEGDVICVTDDGAQVYNLPLMIEGIEIMASRGFCDVTLHVRKFANTLYDDSVAERQIPVIVEMGSDVIFAP